MTATRLSPGDRLGRYEILDRVAVEGRCAHYLARVVEPHGLGASVLVKCFEGLEEDKAFVAMAFDEAALMKILVHPNIVQLLELGRAGDHYFMVMEYVAGDHLYRITREARLPLPASLAVGIGVAAGLHYAHEKTLDGRALELVHTDVSPATVLVSGGGIVKLADFKLVRVLGTSGKRRYLSPEQVRGLPLDRRSDIWNLGLVLYELTTGRFPFAGDDELTIYTSILKQEIEPPSRRDPSYPEALERIVMTALQRDPDRRQRTAGELGRDLEGIASTIGDCSPAALARFVFAG